MPVIFYRFSFTGIEYNMIPMKKAANDWQLHVDFLSINLPAEIKLPFPHFSICSITAWVTPVKENPPS